MIYVCGIIGFVLGFSAGLFIINLFLRQYPTNELMRNKSLRWTYGLFCWILAGLGAWAGVFMYQSSVPQ